MYRRPLRFRPGRFAILVVLTFVALALPADSSSADQPSAAESSSVVSEELRQRLSQLAAGFEGREGFDAARIAEVQSKITAMTPAELELISRRLGELSGDWHRLPEVLDSLAALHEQQRQELIRDFLDRRIATAKGPAPEAELERFRTELRFFVARMRAFVPALADPAFEARLDRIESNLAALPDEALPELRKQFYRWAPGIKAQLRSGAAASGGKLIFDSCDGDCSFPDVDCFITEINCDITEATSQLTSFLTSIATFFTDIINDIDGFFTQTIPAAVDTVGDFFTELGNDLLDLLEEGLNALLDLIPDAEELLGLMGLDFDDLLAAADFFVDLVENSDPISLPCPDIGIEIGDFGTVGTPRAEYMCTRGIDWLSEKLYDLIPDDGVASAIKYPAALLYYPIKYFCMCMEAQSQLCFADGQATHRDLVADNLDTLMSLVASQTSVDDLQTSTNALDVGVADVQTAVDDVTADVATVTSELGIVEGKVDDLGTAVEERLTLTEAMFSLEMRLDIEENLLTGAVDPVASFQFPEAFAGFLEIVAGIVEDTIVMNLAAGQEIGTAESFLARGHALYDEGAFEKAYLDYRRAYREAVRVVSAGPGPSPGGGRKELP